MIEIKGKDGGVLQFEVNYMTGAEYTFCYKNDDIFFMCRDDDDGSSIMSFRFYLEELLENNPHSTITEKLHPAPDSWLTTQLKMFFPTLVEEIPEPLIKESGHDSCSFDFVYPDASLECKKIENSSDYIIEFKFCNPYFDMNIDENEDQLIFKGSLLVTEEALLAFYRGLSSR